MSLVLRWRMPEPRIATRWRGPAGLADAIEREPLYPVAAVVGPPGTGSAPVFPPLAVAANATAPAPLGGTGSGAWSTELNEPVFWDGIAWRTVAHFVDGTPPPDGGDPEPAFHIDYTTGTLDPAVALARAAGPATWFDGTGIMQVTGTANIPRLDHDPVTLAPLGLLVEPAATNRLTYSSDFSNAVWSDRLNGTFSPDAVTAPDGTTTGLRFTPTGGDSYFRHGTFSSGLSANSAYRLSIWLKGSAGHTFRIYNLQGLEYHEVTVTTAWQRFDLSYTTDGTGKFWLQIGGLSTLTAEVHVWGPQLEAGSVATTYIPTTGSSATRAADQLTVTVPLGFSSLTVTYDDDSTSSLACVEGTNVYTAADFSRTRIKSMEGVA